MSEQGQKTEQPTPKRLKKAREEGQAPSAKEFVAAAQFATALLLFSTWGHTWWDAYQQTLRNAVARSFSIECTPQELVHLVRDLLRGMILPLATAAAILIGVTIALQLAATKFGFSVKKLAPNFNRLNPISKLSDLPQQNLSSAGRALLLLALLGWLAYYSSRELVTNVFLLPVASLPAALTYVYELFRGVLWKAAGLLLVVGVLDLLRQHSRHSKQLRMTKQEVREEHKESEGNPQMKAQIRRLRRDLLRRKMMREVPTATAVIVNPTHYAIAIRYQEDTHGAPLVIAKGKNYLALRIRQIAIDNQILLIENPPLAQALYKSVSVGQEVPPQFYRALAEVLAYVYRVMQSSKAR